MTRGSWRGADSIEARALREALDLYRRGRPIDAAAALNRQAVMTPAAVAVSLAATAADAEGITRESILETGGLAISAAPVDSAVDGPTLEELGDIAAMGGFIGVVVVEGPEAGIDAFEQMDAGLAEFVLQGLMDVVAGQLNALDARDN